MGKVAKGVLNFLVSFLFLLLAFACSFMILFRDQPSFGNVLGTFVKVMMMMLGEVEYEDLYYPEGQNFNLSLNGTTTIISENLGQQFPVTTHLFVLLFIFLVSIIVMNLLVGLAVSDIQGLQKSAKLHRLIQQVELINSMEGILFSPLFSFLPEQVQRLLPTNSRDSKDTTIMSTLSNPSISMIKLCQKTLRNRSMKTAPGAYLKLEKTIMKKIFAR